MNTEAIQARIAGRKAAEDLVSLLSWEDGHGADFADAFLTKMRELLPQRRSKATTDNPPPLWRLANTEMPFGAHSGLRFCDINEGYLDWLCRSQEEFLATLQAYLRHPDRKS